MTDQRVLFLSKYKENKTVILLFSENKSITHSMYFALVSWN